MADFQSNAVGAPPPVSHVRPIEPPRPPKAQSDHQAMNPATSSRGPAVVLSGGVAKGAEKHGQQSHAETPHGAGGRVNHLV